MTDREEREEHIKRLEAALACEEKQSSGKCSKQTCDDNCDLLYEQGNWGEWKETLRYAINSLKIDLKYDLLYEETSGQADKQADKPTTKNDVPENNVGKIKPTTKKDLAVDAVSRKAVQTRLKEIINEMETIFADIREREVNDSVCGLCEYDCDHGLDGFANECPGFEKDDCFKLNEKYKAEWLDISNLPSVTPQLSSGLEKNSKKLEKDFGESDCISRQATVKRLCKLAEFMNEHKEESGAPYIMAALFIQDNKTEFPSVTPQEPKSEWEHDHEILRAYADGANNVLDKLRAEIDKLYEREGSSFDRLNALDELKEFIDKHKAETEEENVSL